jgi:hydrogenase expression/formation protein HypE
VRGVLPLPQVLEGGDEGVSEKRDERKEFALSCPIPITEYPHIVLGHGGGGTLSHALIEKMFVPSFDNALLDVLHDGAVFDVEKGKLAFTTDSYVVRPIFFPGGDIGSLAVNGTVNDLAMCGARPLVVSAGFILEEGLPMDDLWRIVTSMKEAARAAGVAIVTGDTKVVDKGKGDQIFINTSGVGVVEATVSVAPKNVRSGDAVLLNGDIGRHGMAVMAKREGLEFEGSIESDCAPLADLVMTLLARGIDVHCLRDLTRGGLGTATVEIARSAALQIDIDETAVPVSAPVRAACEFLGLDPIYVANEGRFIAFVPEESAGRALDIMRSHALGSDARRIGTVTAGRPGMVTLLTPIGTRAIIDMLSGEQLPRIC